MIPRRFVPVMIRAACSCQTYLFVLYRQRRIVQIKSRPKGRNLIFDSRKSRVPQGYSENSPAFERRGLTLINAIQSRRDG